MIYLKNFNWMLFLLVFIVTTQIGLVFRTERLIRTVDEIEPVIILKEIPEEPKVTEPLETTEAVETIEEPMVVDEVETAEEAEPIAVISETVAMHPRVDCPLSDGIQQMILDTCVEYDIDFTLAMALIHKESSFRTDVISKSNDYGLMQINRINHKWLSEELGITDFLDPQQNVTAGLYMLHNLFKKYDEPTKVLMAYNMGESGAKRLWNQGIYSTDYAEDILQQVDKYNAEIAERMGEYALHR